MCCSAWPDPAMIRTWHPGTPGRQGLCGPCPCPPVSAAECWPEERGSRGASHTPSGTARRGQGRAGPPQPPGPACLSRDSAQNTGGAREQTASQRGHRAHVYPQRGSCQGSSGAPAPTCHPWCLSRSVSARGDRAQARACVRVRVYSWACLHVNARAYACGPYLETHQCLDAR